MSLLIVIILVPELPSKLKPVPSLPELLWIKELSTVICVAKSHKLTPLSKNEISQFLIVIFDTPWTEHL